jgi:hypothetical protein
MLEGGVKAPQRGTRRGAARLFDVVPDLRRLLSAEDALIAERVVLPVETVRESDVDLSARIASVDAFGVVVMDGVLVHRLQIGERTALRLLGPGDIYCLGGENSTILLGESRWTVAGPTRLALLGSTVLMAARRFPQVIREVLIRTAEQAERGAAHLVINQLPRVDQRLVAVMWLLAEKWGYVTPAGTVLPLALTHETLGALTGARRPTITLALTRLTESGQIVKTDAGWLIVAPPPEGAASVPAPAVPQLLKAAEDGVATGASQRQPGSPHVPLRERTLAVLKANELIRQSTREQIVALRQNRDRQGELVRSRERRVIAAATGDVQPSG